MFKYLNFFWVFLIDNWVFFNFWNIDFCRDLWLLSLFCIFFFKEGSLLILKLLIFFSFFLILGFLFNVFWVNFGVFRRLWFLKYKLLRGVILFFILLDFFFKLLIKILVFFLVWEIWLNKLFMRNKLFFVLLIIFLFKVKFFMFLYLLIWCLKLLDFFFIVLILWISFDFFCGIVCIILFILLIVWLIKFNLWFVCFI